MPKFVIRRFLLIVLGMSFIAPVGAQAQGSRPRVALFEPTGQGADAVLTAALKTVGDSVELDLACLQRYEVRRLKGVDPARELDKVRAYCRTNRVDQAIMGSGSTNPREAMRSSWHSTTVEPIPSPWSRKANPRAPWTCSMPRTPWWRPSWTS